MTNQPTADELAEAIIRKIGAVNPPPSEYMLPLICGGCACLVILAASLFYARWKMRGKGISVANWYVSWALMLVGMALGLIGAITDILPNPHWRVASALLFFFSPLILDIMWIAALKDIIERNIRKQEADDELDRRITEDEHRIFNGAGAHG